MPGLTSGSTGVLESQLAPANDVDIHSMPSRWKAGGGKIGGKEEISTMSPTVHQTIIYAHRTLILAMETLRIYLADFVSYCQRRRSRVCLLRGTYLISALGCEAVALSLAAILPNYRPRINL